MKSEATPGYRAPREVAHTVVLSVPDPAWAATYEVEQARIRAAVGDALVGVHHVGSTAVPGLAAKPIIDILLLVRDSTAEQSYVPALEAAGYVFRWEHVQDYADAKSAVVRKSWPGPGAEAHAR